MFRCNLTSYNKRHLTTNPTNGRRRGAATHVNVWAASPPPLCVSSCYVNYERGPGPECRAGARGRPQVSDPGVGRVEGRWSRRSLHAVITAPARSSVSTAASVTLLGAGILFVALNCRYDTVGPYSPAVTQV